LISWTPDLLLERTSESAQAYVSQLEADSWQLEAGSWKPS